MSPRELAAAIRKGHTMVGEAKEWPAVANYPTCALGAALYGAGKTVQEFLDAFFASKSDGRHAMAKVFGISHDLAFKISVKHSGGEERLAIADWLDTLEPAHRQTFGSFMAATLKHVETETI